MMKISTTAAAALLVATMAACSGGGAGGSDAEKLARTLFDAVAGGNEDAFVRLHVMQGDLSPDGQYTITMGPGKGTPDEGWTKTVKAKFAEVRRQLDALQKGGTPAFGGLLKSDDGGHYVGNIAFAINIGGEKHVGRVASAMKSQRGLVITDEPGLTFLSWNEYEKTQK